MTLSGKILILFTLGITRSLVSSRHSTLWGQGVFPDDEKWLTDLAKRTFVDSTSNPKAGKNYNVCETKECKSVADEFISSLNKSVNPCDDFYEFACSGWASKNPIPPNLPAWSRFMMFQNTVHHRVKGLLETEIESSDILPVKQAKKWYRSCMDTETLEARGLKPIESILIRAGGWPISMDEEEWDEDQYTWQEIDRSYARLTGSYAFYDIVTTHGPIKNETFGEIAILPQDLPLNEHMPLKYRNYSGNDYEGYVEFVAGVAHLFVENNRADIAKDKLIEEAKQIVEFEKKIYKLQKHSSYEEMTLEDFIEWYDSNVTIPEDNPKGKIDWQSFVQGLFDIVNIKIDPLTQTYIPMMNYVTGLSELLAQTPTRTIVNYIHWNFVANTLTYTTEAARDALYVLLMEEFGIKERPPRWSECVNEMKMVDAAAYAFVKEYISEHTESEVLKMSKNIQKEMEIQINEAKWLDDESKILAKDKLNSMKIFVGFPDWYKDKKAVLRSYKGLTIGTEYFDNELSYIRYERKKKLKLYRARNDDDEDEWGLDPITVNAMYGMDNTLNIPAADFQAPLFTAQIPDNINYGIVGVIVGHEIGHGFDDTGIQFGKDGDRTKLSKSILKSYFQRADCFSDQFDKYYGETKPPEIEGTTEESRYFEWRKSLRTRGENIADSTGIQTVFEAYRKLEKPKGGSVRLPGLEEFTDDQLFFLSFAAMWCEVETPQFEKKKKKSMDPHSPAKLRVIGAVSNTKGFAEVFNCPAGSPMNPTDKCSIWQNSDGSPPTELARMMARPNRWERQWKI